VNFFRNGGPTGRGSNGLPQEEVRRGKEHFSEVFRAGAPHEGLISVPARPSPALWLAKRSLG